MGYWWPPTMFAFDPVERPLILAGSGPNDYDAELLDMISATPTYRGLGRLGCYAALIRARAPEDPAPGGLAADSIDPDGAVRVNYWDFSDSGKVRRKQALYVEGASGFELANRSAGEGGVPREWNPEKQVWEKEGPDAEREFWKASPSLVPAVASVVSFAMGAAGAGAAGAAFSVAFSAAWRMGMQATRTGRPPSLEEIASTVGGVLGVIVKDPDLQKALNKSFLGEMGKLGAEGLSYAEKIARVTRDYGAKLPRVDLRAAFGTSSWDPVAWAGGELRKRAADAIEISGIDLSELPQTELYKGFAFAEAGRAFVEPDAASRLQIRRNFVALNSGSSSAVVPGDQKGVAAYSPRDVGPGVLEVSTYFDQFLATLFHASEKTAYEQIGGLVTQYGPTPFRTLAREDPAKQEALYAYADKIRERYRL